MSDETPNPGGIEFPVENHGAVVVVAGLDRDTTETGISVALKPFGPLLAVDLVRDSKGRSRGMGTVTFESQSDAIDAINASGSLRIDGRSPRLRQRVDSDPPLQDSHDGWTEIRRRKDTPKLGR